MSSVERQATDRSSEDRYERRVREPSPRARSGAECVHRLVESQAAQTPGAIAVSCGGQRLSYRALNERANRVAHHLRALGVGPETPVGLCLDRSVEMVAGLLGILKAGGAYVPLDPAYPSDRLAFMLADSRAAVVLTREDLRERLPDHAARVVCLDRDGPRIAAGPGENPLGGAMAGHLAYILYTSGSTGRPKGVQVTHGALSGFLLAMLRLLGMTARDAMLAVTTLSFDIAALELYLPLIVGGRIELAGRDEANDGSRLAARLGEPGITFLQATPASWRMLLDAGWEGTPGLTILCGGEALPRDLADRLLARGEALWNLYGPTETTIWSSAARVEPGDGPIAIGRPIANTWMYVLDRQMQPVPIGVVGELFIGGLGVARGYLGRPGLTAERFLPDPFGRAPGGRLYRTGDLARWRHDGSLECLGRVDHQVKVRGFRIELGEIEAALRKHPAVREAVVVAHEDATGEKGLAAYFVADPPAPPPPEVRRFLKDSLPDYMVPSAFVALDALPLTPNGKVDRNALPPPERVRSSSEAEYEPPRGPVEEAVAGIWGELLGSDRVGARDNFFDLGGHSLIATQVVSRLRAALGVEVPVRALFEAPTVAGLAGRVEAARREREVRGGAAPPIRPLPRAVAPSSPLPLSFAQQALWYLDQLAPGQPTFNVTAAVRISGPLDLEALRRAFNAIIGRHEAMRTTFATVDGNPVQVITPDLALPLPLVDLATLTEDRRDAEARRLATEEAQRPFDLACGPLVRAGVLRLSEREHAVLLTMHHIVTDGWSFGVAVAELAALYQAFHAGTPSPLPDLPIQYADFAAWQRDWLRGEVLDALLGYWTGRLAGVPPLELPTDRPRPALRTTRGAVEGFALTPDLSRRLHALGRREATTPFMTLLAAFQVLLHRYSGQEDFAVGSPIANRNRAETEGLIGYFVNMIALRADLSGDPSIRTLLGQTREATLGAYEHQDLPLELLIERLHPRRDPSRTPLFQVMFVLQNNQMPDVGREELEFNSLEGGGKTGTAKFDLSLIIEDTGEEFAGGFEYNTDLFDRGTIARMAGHFRALLESIVADPDRPLSDLPILPELERHQLLSDWGRNPGDDPRDRGVHQLVEAQAGRTPGAIAVALSHARGGGSLTYRELNERANRLARYLRGRGVGPEVPVGIAVERAPELAVGLLGILKAGGAYVPLDPAYPSDRLAFMLGDAGVRVLLTRDHLRGHLQGHAADVVCLDADWEAIASESKEELACDVRPEQAAYIIYTSGTTGRPRGVVVTHKGLVNHARAAATLFNLRPDDRVLQFSSLSFDIAVEELFPAWTRGAAVVLRDDEMLDPDRFSSGVEREGITVLDLPTAFWHAWVGDLSHRKGRLPGCLRLVVVGGEEALPTAYASWRKLGGDGIRWLNTYGPTEATVIATVYEPPVSKVDGETPSEVELPIGRPIANARTYVLDPRLQPVPIGLPGELFVGGLGVARGYINQAALTAERFLPDPFADDPGARMYRTGDLARWRADGQLEFLGRADDQVKVRGFRVEPGEVESALLRCPGVREAAVAVREDGAGDESLVAYVVGGDGRAVPAEELRQSLKRRLPRYMVPATFVTLDALPLTPSGKVDRRALPPLGPAAGGRESAVIGPRDALEAQLVPIWEEVLGVRPVGVVDDFFDLGGHSLLAVRLMARIEERFGRAVPLSSLLLGASIEDVARALRDGPASAPGAWSPLVAIEPGGPGAPFFCVHPIGGGVLCYRDLARRLGRSRPVYGLQAAGLDSGGAPESRLETIAGRYVKAIRTVQPEGPYHLGGWSMGGVVAFEMARRLREQGQEVATLALIDSSAPAARRRRFRPDDAEIQAAFAADLARSSGVTDLGAEVGPERRRRLLDVFRANAQALADFVPRPHPGRLVLFRADESGAGDPTLGWAAQAGEVAVHVLPGDHYTLVRPPWVDALAGLLDAEIGKG